MSADNMKCYIKDCLAVASWECRKEYLRWGAYCDKHFAEHMVVEELFEVKRIRQSSIGARKGKP